MFDWLSKVESNLSHSDVCRIVCDRFDTQSNAERLRDFVERFYPPFWKEFNGGDHIVSAVGDRGCAHVSHAAKQCSLVRDGAV